MRASWSYWAFRPAYKIKSQPFADKSATAPFLFFCRAELVEIYYNFVTKNICLFLQLGV
ncbi:MAG: hypothetical protein LUE31_00325 [Lachnospiraceae bacterium]|nr:hypothetical protein [Lachnospiraceae bacterium]